MKKSILIAAILSITSIASALTESFTITIPTDTNPGTISFTGLGLDPLTVTAIDLSFESTLSGSVDYSVVSGTATNLNIGGTSSITLNPFTFLTTPLPPGGVTESNFDFIANATAGDSGNVGFTDSDIDLFSVNDIIAFYAGSKDVSYSAATGGSFSAASSNSFNANFTTNGAYTIEATATYTLVPEPSAGILFGIGMAILIGRRRRQ